MAGFFIAYVVTDLAHRRGVFVHHFDGDGLYTTCAELKKPVAASESKFAERAATCRFGVAEV